MITIGDLIKTLELEHKFDEGFSLLNLPLALISEKEYADLITILWFYGEELITGKPTIDDNTGAEVEEFYHSVKGQMSKNNLFRIAWESDAEINAQQITFYLKDHPLYEFLKACSRCPEEFIFFLKWNSKADISNLEKFNFASLLDTQKRQNARDASIASLVNVLARLNLSGETPIQYYIYQCLIKINSDLLNLELEKNNPDEEILGYLHTVLHLLSTKYQMTLKDLYARLGIAIPNISEPKLRTLLKLDLRQINGLDEQQWPQFLFYVSLFVFNLAEINDSLLELLESGLEIPSSLKMLSAPSAVPLHQQAEMFARRYGSMFLAQNRRTHTFKNFNNFLITKITFDLHPMLIALNCLEQCEPLGNILTEMWRQENPYKAPCHNLVMSPSTNRFLQGEILCLETPLIIMDDDLKLLTDSISNAKKEKPTRSVGFVSNTKKPLKDAKPQSMFSFFGAVLGEVQYQVYKFLDVNDVQEQIQKLKLPYALYVDTISELPGIYAIDYEAIIEFMNKYGINSPHRIPPTYQALKELFYIFRNEDILEDVIKELMGKLFAKLEHDSESLHSQVINLEESIVKLDKILESFTTTTEDEELALRVEWLKIQHKTFTRFKEMIQNRRQSLEDNGSGLKP